MYIRRHRTADAEVCNFRPLTNEAQKGKAGEKRLAEQLADLQKELQDEM